MNFCKRKEGKKCHALVLISKVDLATRVYFVTLNWRLVGLEV
jgi:hypothetical protein